MPELHKPKKGQFFNIGVGTNGVRCRVTNVKDNMVDYEVIKDQSTGFFLMGAPQHVLATWEDEE